MERLIKKDKNGRERFTDIRVEDLGNGTADIVKVCGVVGSDKMTESRTNVKTGYEKAVNRAITMWSNERTKCTEILPMLANKWEDRQRYISEPFYVQPKIDGVRLLVSNKGCFSRTGKPVEGVEHLARGLKDGEYLDGECYVPNKTFEEITSMFKMNPKDLEFHVFDYFDLNRPNLTFEERKARISIDTFLVNSKDGVQKYHDMFVQQGHEGVMIRDASSIYEIGKRSNYLLKYKEFHTEEYEIVDVKEGTGREKGAAIWVCKVREQHFSAKPEGTLEVRRKYLEEKDKYIGKQLTVRYQNLTALGVPRFPVGVAIRDYE
jgi:ATP-dependent DNA ligase